MLFTAQELSDFLQSESVDSAGAAAAERVVYGWLKPVLGWVARPAPVPDEAWPWVITLAAIAYENPAGMDEYQLGQEKFKYGSTKAEILAEAAAFRRSGGVVSDPAGIAPPASPRGSFPAAQPFPRG